MEDASHTVCLASASAPNSPQGFHLRFELNFATALCSSAFSLRSISSCFFVLARLNSVIIRVVGGTTSKQLQKLVQIWIGDSLKNIDDSLKSYTQLRSTQVVSKHTVTRRCSLTPNFFGVKILKSSSQRIVRDYQWVSFKHGSCVEVWLPLFD